MGIEILEEKLKIIEESIIRAENNARVANNRLSELKVQKDMILNSVTWLQSKPATQEDIATALVILENAKEKSTVKDMRDDIDKAKDILEKKEVSK